MCGRYALGIRAAFIRYQLQQQNIPVDETPEDDEARESYNFAPGYYGLVYRIESPRQHHNRPPGGDESDAGAQSEEAAASDKTDRPDDAPPKHKLQAMKWGLVPFWTKRNPDYKTLMRTINCRDDSLMENRGMWTSMKKTKRCIVIAQGFYEWQKKNNGKEKIPHFVRRKDNQLMLLAGLWDRVRYEDTEEDLWTYTIITTDNNKQLAFLHDRMPVILEPNSDEMWKWLDPERTSWSSELQSILKPYNKDLECYAVSKEVGKVGNNSPDFLVPIASKANKQNIVNFFDAQKTSQGAAKPKPKDDQAIKEEELPADEAVHDRVITPSNMDELEPSKLKRAAPEDASSLSPKKAIKMEQSPLKPVTSPLGKKARDATSNGPRPKLSPAKPESSKSKKITSFFGKA